MYALFLVPRVKFVTLVLVRIGLHPGSHVSVFWFYLSLSSQALFSHVHKCRLFHLWDHFIIVLWTDSLKFSWNLGSLIVLPGATGRERGSRDQISKPAWPSHLVEENQLTPLA